MNNTDNITLKPVGKDESEESLDYVAGLEEYATNFSRMADKYLYARLKYLPRPLNVLQKPFRLNCMTIMLCRRGSMNVEVKMQPYHIKANSLLVVPPTALIKTCDEDLSRLDLYVLFVSSKFLVDINIDLNALNIRSLIESHSPVMQLTDAEATKLVKYIELLDINACEPEVTVFSINVARSLVAAVFYQLLQINFLRINRAPDDPNTPVTRRSTYVHDFLRLLHLNYMRERSVAFYASQLFISPKYLTLLVKEATGRNATQWINEFVIVEAKNMLRFSGKNVQQVAYALNFSNQSAFGKYFKHLTGISPTAYQKL